MFGGGLEGDLGINKPLAAFRDNSRRWAGLVQAANLRGLVKMDAGNAGWPSADEIGKSPYDPHSFLVGWHSHRVLLESVGIEHFPS